MLFIFFILLLIVIIFAREIKFIIGIFLLYALTLALWEYWWGKAITIAFLLFIIMGALGKVIEVIKKRKMRESNNDYDIREKAYLYAIEGLYKSDSESVKDSLDAYRSWRTKPSSQPHIEEWYQENKEYFNNMNNGIH